MSLKLGIFCLKVRRHAQALLKAGLCKVLSCPYAPQLCLKLSLDKISTRSNTSLLLRLSRCQAVSCSHNSSSAAADQAGPPIVSRSQLVARPGLAATATHPAALQASGMQWRTNKKSRIVQIQRLTDVWPGADKIGCCSYFILAFLVPSLQYRLAAIGQVERLSYSCQLSTGAQPASKHWVMRRFQYLGAVPLPSNCSQWMLAFLQSINSEN